MTSFEIVSLIINGGLLVATAGATAVAWKMALEASRDKSDAEAARDAAVQAQRDTAASLSTANAIAQDALDAQRLALPPVWGSPERTAGRDFYSIRNTSGRTLIVSGLDSLPGGNVYVFLAPDLPTRVENGDVVRFTATLGGSTSTAGNSVELRWAYADEPEIETSTVRRF